MITPIVWMFPNAGGGWLGWKISGGTLPVLGDFTERGSDGRDWQVAVVAAHAIVWRVDDAVCEVKVVAIRAADV